MTPLLRQLVSQVYFWDRARAGKVGRKCDIGERESVFRSERSVVERVRLEKLRRLLRHASEHVPYYRDLFRERGFDPDKVTSVDALLALPVLDKEVIRAAGERMISQALPQSSLIRNASGGSTGAPLHFYQGANFLAESRIAAPLFDAWTGWRRADSVALLWGAPTDIARHCMYRERVRNFFKNRFLVDAFDMNSSKLQTAIATIRRRRPVLVVAYASAAYMMARYMKRHGVVLEHPPRAVLCSAEVLWPHYRELIEEQFGCKVHNRYGSREVGLIAMECAEGTLHTNDTGVVVQVEQPDDDGVGNLLVTQLDNFAFPFIRYRIGDVGASRQTNCNCGRSLGVLTDLRGRVGDYIIAPGGAVIHGEWFTHLFYNVEGVARFTFRQTSKQNYVFEVQREQGFRADQLESAMVSAREKLGPNATVDVVFVERFEATSSGKHRFVINECTESAETTDGGARRSEVLPESRTHICM